MTQESKLPELLRMKDITGADLPKHESDLLATVMQARETLEEINGLDEPGDCYNASCDALDAIDAALASYYKARAALAAQGEGGDDVEEVLNRLEGWGMSRPVAPPEGQRVHGAVSCTLSHPADWPCPICTPTAPEPAGVVAWQFFDRGHWHMCHSDKHMRDTADALIPVRPLYTHPAPQVDEALIRAFWERAEWVRQGGETFLSVRVADGADLSCTATRRAALIVAAVNALPALLAERDALAARVEGLEAELARVRACQRYDLVACSGSGGDVWLGSDSDASGPYMLATDVLGAIAHAPGAGGESK